MAIPPDIEMPGFLAKEFMMAQANHAQSDYELWTVREMNAAPVQAQKAIAAFEVAQAEKQSARKGLCTCGCIADASACPEYMPGGDCKLGCIEE